MSPRSKSNLLRLAGPLIFSFWFRSAFQWVDTFYAASLGDLGDASIAAIGLTAPLEFLLIATWVGLSSSLTSRMAAAMGAREGAKIEQLLKSTRRLVTLLRITFLGFAVLIYLLASRLPLDPEVAQQFGIYGPVLIGGSALTSFWSVIPDSVVKAHNDTRSTMWAGLISTLTNFVLNTVFVFVFHWGIMGIAAATVLARLGGLLYALGRARFHEDRRLAKGEDNVPGLFEHPRRKLLALAIPASLGFGLLALEGLVINGMLAAQQNSEAALAAWSIMDRAARFMMMPIIATGVALLPLAARLWGARDIDGVSQELRVGLGAAVGYSLLVALPVAWFGGPRLAVALTDSPHAQEVASTGLRWVFALALVGGPLFLFRSAFEGMQQARPGLVVSLLRTFGLILPLCAAGLYLAPLWHLSPVIGLMIGAGLGAGLASLLLGLWMRRFLAQARMHNRLVLE